MKDTSINRTGKPNTFIDVRIDELRKEVIGKIDQLETRMRDLIKRQEQMLRVLVAKDQEGK